MDKKRLIIIALIVAIVGAATVFAVFRINSAEAGLPKWLPQNLMTEIKSLNRNNPKVRQLVLEINSIHVKDPKHPPKTLILKIESQIERIKYQESIHKPYTPSKPTPEQLKNLKKIQPFYTAGKPYCLVTPDNNNPDMDFYKALPPDQLKWYNFTSVVAMPYAELDSGVEKADLSSVSPVMKGDPTLGIIIYTLMNPKTGEEIYDIAKFPGKGAATAVKVMGNVVYYKFKDGEILSFDTKYPKDGKVPSMKFISKMP